MEAHAQCSQADRFQIWQCQDDRCRFRFPGPDLPEETQSCPKCRGMTVRVGDPFIGRGASAVANGKPWFQLEVLLDNLRSSHNVGSIFRSCDGAGVERVHLCGITATPRQGKIGKAALGAEETVPWSYHLNGVETVRSCRDRGLRILSLENREPNGSLFDLNRDALDQSMLLVVGNELAGVDPAIIALSDQVVSIPMLGQKSSLNAAVAFGIAAYWLQYGVR